MSLDFAIQTVRRRSAGFVHSSSLDFEMSLAIINLNKLIRRQNALNNFNLNEDTPRIFYNDIVLAQRRTDIIKLMDGISVPCGTFASIRNNSQYGAQYTTTCFIIRSQKLLL